MRGAVAEPSRRSVNEEALRVDGRTLTIALRAARKPCRCTRTRYGPGGSCLSVYCPVLIGHGESGGAAERGNDRAVERLAELVGDLAFDEAGVGGGDVLVTGSTLRRPAPRHRVECNASEAEHDRSDQATGGPHPDVRRPRLGTGRCIACGRGRPEQPARSLRILILALDGELDVLGHGLARRLVGDLDVEAVLRLRRTTPAAP